MAGEIDQILRVTDEPISNESKSDSGIESDVLTMSSSFNMVAAKMANKTTPEMVDYSKKMTITKADRKDYHCFG
jgi:hypothetical protein